MQDKTYKQAAQASLSRPELIPYMGEIVTTFFRLGRLNHILETEQFRRAIVATYNRLESEYVAYGELLGPTTPERVLLWWKGIVDSQEDPEQQEER